VQDLLVRSSVVNSKTTVVDERVFRRFGSGGLEIRGACWRFRLRLFGFGN